MGTVYAITLAVALALVSVVAFVLVSTYAWRHNVWLLNRCRLWCRQSLTTWHERRRAAHDPGYRQWRNTVRQYEGLTSLLLTFVQNERLHLGLERDAEDERTRGFHRRQYEKFRAARIQTAPYVALRLSEFTAGELLIVAKHLAGFDYDHPPSADDWCGPLDGLATLLNEQKRVLKCDPTRVVSELERLQEFRSASRGAKTA